MPTHAPAEVFPPGEFIRDELEARDWTQADLAKILGKPLPAVNELIAGKKAITPETARALAAAFGTSADLWMNLESAYRLSLAAPSDQDVARRAEIYSVVPVNSLTKRGWLPSCKSVDELEGRVLRFYGVESIDQIQARRFAARKSTSYCHPCTADEWAWFRRAVQLATAAPASDYDPQTMRSQGLKALRALTASEADARKIPEVLAELGVRLVVVKGLPRMRVDGAAFWLQEQQPAIALSLRFERIDAVWFTLAHELCHLLHDEEPAIDSNLVGKDRQPTEAKPEAERQADQFASDFLIPQDELRDFIQRVRPLYSKAKIRQFADHIGVHPGIVVGQLQFRREIGWSHSREWLVSVRRALLSTARADGWEHAAAEQ